jgi:hypothetical protein
MTTARRLRRQVIAQPRAGRLAEGSGGLLDAIAMPPGCRMRPGHRTRPGPGGVITMIPSIEPGD